MNDSESVKFFSKDDEKQFLIKRIAGNDFFKTDFDYLDLINKLNSTEDDALRLKMIDIDASKTIDLSLLKRIADSIDSLKKICRKPRMFLDTKEEKVPIDIARNISPKAISAISRDSNDWYARTILTIRPKRVIVFNQNETVDRYENKVVCALIDRIEKVMKIVKMEFDRIEAELTNKSNFTTAYERYKKYSKKTFSMKLSEQFEVGAHRFDSSDFDDDKEKIRKIMRDLKEMRHSELYKELRHKKRQVVNPIERTNLFIGDRNYKAAYNLWKDLDKKAPMEIPSYKRNKFPDKELQSSYFLFVFVYVCAALHDMGYEEVSRESISFQNNILSIGGDGHDELIFKKRRYTVRCSIDYSEIIPFIRLRTETEVKIRNLGKVTVQGGKSAKKIGEQNIKNEDYKKVGYEIQLVPNYLKSVEIDGEKIPKDIISSVTKELLDMDITEDDKDKKDKKTTKKDPLKKVRYQVISVDSIKYSNNVSHEPYLCRRLASMGDNFDPTEEKNDEWNHFKKGILNISPLQLQLNFIKIERMLYLRLLTPVLDDVSSARKTFLTECPICGTPFISGKNRKYEPDIDSSGNYYYKCEKCGRKISETYCSNCDKEHKRRIFWIRYTDDEFISDVKLGSKEDDDNYYLGRLEGSEFMMGDCALTSFIIDDDKKLRTICPHCGNVIGHTKEPTKT